MNLLETVLQKKGVRTDSFWTRTFPYRFLQRIPFECDVRALMQSQYWPRERIETYQDARLAQLLRTATSMPFWNDVFTAAGVLPATGDRVSLSKLPIMQKKTLADMPIEAYTDMPSAHNFWFDHTSGSTGRPFSFVHDSNYELRLFAVCERMYRTATGNEHLHLISMRPRWRQGIIFKKRGTYFYIKGYNSVPFRLQALREECAKHSRGVLLHGFGTPLLHLAHLAQDQNLTLPIRAILGSGEGLTDTQRAFVSTALHAPLFMSYVSRELGFLAYECERGGMHINEEWAYIEIVDSDGRPLPDGTEGRVVATTFDNLVMPFIRYYTGDIGTIHSKPCPCGRTLKTISVHGREASLIDLGNGRETSLLEVAGTFDRFFDVVRHYQIVQEAAHTFTMRVVPGPAFTERKEHIQSALLRVLHPDVSITWETVETIPEAPSGKTAYFIKNY